MAVSTPSVASFNSTPVDTGPDATSSNTVKPIPARCRRPRRPPSRLADGVGLPSLLTRADTVIMPAASNDVTDDHPEPDRRV